MRTAILSFAGPVIVAVYLPFCASEIKTVTPSGTAPVSVWRDPAPIETRDLFSGPWGADRAPDPEAVYRLIQRKHTGINPGMTVVDPENREWSVKLAPPDGRPSEAQVEVVVSRILSASGYHQPPVYYLPGFIVEDDFGTRREGGGRFRLKLSSLKDRGDWSWQQNPFVEAPEFNTLLVILMMLNASDIKNSNNTVYEYRAGKSSERWYVVRDIGSALGSTGRFAPIKGDADAFAGRPLLAPTSGAFVEFRYHGWHQELVRNRITRDDLARAVALLERLTARQWLDAFRAGGYTAAQAQPFIDVIASRLAEARSASHTAAGSVSQREADPGAR
jgi:hypothetical protein